MVWEITHRGRQYLITADEVLDNLNQVHRLYAKGGGFIKEAETLRDLLSHFKLNDAEKRAVWETRKAVK